jgi:hypothetical protein
MNTTKTSIKNYSTVLIINNPAKRQTTIFPQVVLTFYKCTIITKQWD